jgi:hypothetical protein
MMSAVIWDVTHKNRRFGGTYRHYHPDGKNQMEAIRSSETSVLTRATHRHICEDDIIHSHRRENLKSYVALSGWALLRKCTMCIL